MTIEGTEGIGHISERELREYEFPDQLWIIEGEVPVATYTMIIAAPKVGKTMLTLPLAQDIADKGWRTYYAAMDDSPKRMKDRSLKSSPDKARDNLTFAGWLTPETAPEFWTPNDMAEAFADLKATLLLAKLAGDPIDVAFIDTYGVFTAGAGRSTDSVFKADYTIGAAIKKLCAEFQVAIFANHHARKGGTIDGDWMDMVNGSSGVTASVDQTWYLTGVRGSTEGILRMSGNDVEEKAFPLIRDGQSMRWNPDPNVTSAMAERTGVPRAVLEMLTEGKATLPEMVGELDEKRNTIKVACQRLQNDGLIFCQGNDWHLDKSHPKNSPIARGRILEKGAPPAPEGRTALAPCRGCGLDAVYQYGGEPWHVVCKQRADEAQALAAEEPVMPPRGTVGMLEDPEEGSEPERFKAFKSLEDSVKASRKHPVLWIPKDKRDAAPWSLITERMSGEHRWKVDAPADSTVTKLDRRGSYFAAMSNVPVSANLMTRTGPLDVLDKTRAGIYLIPPVRWIFNDNMGHPLGKIHDPDADSYWVSTPHMRLLDRLADQGVIIRPKILDSWTGLAATNLFEKFYIDVREARAATVDDEEARNEVKRMASVATRALWLKNPQLKTPFWRPDWSVSVRAEASVRHWAKAWQAVQNGAECVGLRVVDEAAFVIPAGVPMSNWVPAPYVIGEKYGEVSVKGLVTCEEWNGGRR